MKCPFCQQELEERHAATTDYNSMFITYYCGNPECESTTDLIGCKEFWDILGQLIRTRKALEIARKVINQVMSMGAKNNICYHLKAKTVKRILGNAIEQIEQKDEK